MDKIPPTLPDGSFDFFSDAQPNLSLSDILERLLLREFHESADPARGADDAWVVSGTCNIRNRAYGDDIGI